MTTKLADRKKKFSLPCKRKKVILVTNLETELPEMYLETISQKTVSLFAKIKEKLATVEQKILSTIKKIAETIKKYWQCLMLSGRILVLVMKKIRERGYLNCEKN